ncbi:hypothetical protein ABK040_000714 [Willaertia magna]
MFKKDNKLKEAIERNKEINEKLKRNYKYQQTLNESLPILLMGSSNCGIKTFLYQLQFYQKQENDNLIDDNLISDNKEKFKKNINLYILYNLKKCFNYLRDRNQLVDKFNDLCEDDFCKVNNDDGILKGKIVKFFEYLKKEYLNKNFIIQEMLQYNKIYKNYTENFIHFLTNDNTKYLTKNNILHSYHKNTNGNILELFFKKDPTDFQFRFLDLTGQLNERRKWFHYQFEDFNNYIFYFISLNDFFKMNEFKNNKLIENINCLQELLIYLNKNLNKKILNKRGLIYVIFTKFDLFLENIKIFKFSNYFKDYNGSDGDANEMISYLEKYIFSKKLNCKVLFTILNVLNEDNFKKSLENGCNLVKHDILDGYGGCLL